MFEMPIDHLSGGVTQRVKVVIWSSKERSGFRIHIFSVRMIFKPCICSVTKSCLILCDPMNGSTWVLQFSRVCSNWCPLSWWCHPTISSSVTLFSCLQSFSVSGSFPMSGLFESDGQRIGVSVSALVLPIWGWFPNYLSAVREDNKSKNWSLKLSDVKILPKWNNQQKGLKKASIR